MARKISTKTSTPAAKNTEIVEIPKRGNRAGKKQTPSSPPPRVEEEELFEEEEVEEVEDVEEEDEDDEDPDTPPVDDDDDDDDEEEDDDDEVAEELVEEEEETEEDEFTAQGVDRERLSLTLLEAEVTGDVMEPEKPSEELEQNIQAMKAMKDTMPAIAYEAAMAALLEEKQKVSGVTRFMQEHPDASRLEQTAVALALRLQEVLDEINEATEVYNQREDVGSNQRVAFDGIRLQMKPYQGSLGRGIEGGYESRYRSTSTTTTRSTTRNTTRSSKGRRSAISVGDVYTFLVNNGQPNPAVRHKYGGKSYYAVLEGDRLREAEFSNGEVRPLADGKVYDSFNQWVNEYRGSTNAWAVMHFLLPKGNANLKPQKGNWNCDDSGSPIDGRWQTDANKIREAMNS